MRHREYAASWWTPTKILKWKFQTENQNKVIEGMACQHQAMNPKAQILAVWTQTDLQPVKQNLCLAPDQKMVRPKKVANDLKINSAP